MIERMCETCKKKLKSDKEHDECFNKNHNMSYKGLFTLAGELVNVERNYFKDIPLGIATEDTKKGESVRIELK